MTSLVPLKRVARIIAGQSPASEVVSDINGSQLPFLQGNGEFGRMHPRPLFQCDAAPKRARRGDVLLSVRAPVGALNKADRSYGIGRGLCAIRPMPGLDEEFAWWGVSGVSPLLAAVATGSTYSAVTTDDVGALPMPLPTRAAQSAIADYLNRETARIDRLIAAKRRLLFLLEERFWSWADHEIIRTSTAFLPLRRFITRITDGPFGSSLRSTDYSESGARVVRLGNIGRWSFRHEDVAFISEDYFRSLRRHRVVAGDLLIAGLGDVHNHVGRACVAPDLGSAIVKADCYCASVDSTRTTVDFLALYLSSPSGAGNVAIASRGTTRSRINLDIAREIRVPVVPLPMQAHITSAASIMRRRCDELSRKVEDQMALLREHRQALITEAVNGNLEIATRERG